MSPILLSRLRALARPEQKAGQARFFKEDVQPMGLSIPQVRAQVRLFAKEKPTMPLIESEIRSLWSSGYLEARCAAIFLAQFSSLPPARKLSIAKQFLKDPKLNWALSDAISGCVLGPLIIEEAKISSRPRKSGPSALSQTRALIDGNRWERRACIVALILPMRRHLVSVPDVLKLVRVHLHSDWHYSQKACGWVLRECYKKDAPATRRWMALQKNMPRISFSYACERMSKQEKLKLKKKVYG